MLYLLFVLLLIIFFGLYLIEKDEIEHKEYVQKTYLEYIAGDNYPLVKRHFPDGKVEKDRVIFNPQNSSSSKGNGESNER